MSTGTAIQTDKPRTCEPPYSIDELWWYISPHRNYVLMCRWIKSLSYSRQAKVALQTKPLMQYSLPPCHPMWGTLTGYPCVLSPRNPLPRFRLNRPGRLQPGTFHSLLIPALSSDCSQFLCPLHLFSHLFQPDALRPRLLLFELLFSLCGWQFDFAS